MKHRKSAKVDYPNLYASEDAVAKNPAAFVSHPPPQLIVSILDLTLGVEVQLCSASSPEHCRECRTDPRIDPLLGYVTLFKNALRCLLKCSQVYSTPSLPPRTTLFGSLVDSFTVYVKNP
jgi:hypothetical protein